MEVFEEFLAIPFIQPYAFTTQQLLENDRLYVDIDSCVAKYYCDRLPPHPDLALTKITKFAACMRAFFDALLELKEKHKLKLIQCFFSGLSNELLDCQWEFEVRHAASVANISLSSCLDGGLSAAVACCKAQRESASCLERYLFCSSSKNSLFYGVDVIRNITSIVENWGREAVPVRVYTPSRLMVKIFGFVNPCDIAIMGGLFQLKLRPPESKILQYAIPTTTGSNKSEEEEEEGKEQKNVVVSRESLVTAFILFYANVVRNTACPTIDLVEKVLTGETKAASVVNPSSHDAAQKAALSVQLYDLRNILKSLLLKDYEMTLCFKQGTPMWNAFQQGTVGPWVARIASGLCWSVHYNSKDDLMATLRLHMGSALADQAGFGQEMDTDPSNGSHRVFSLLPKVEIKLTNFWPKIPINVSAPLLTILTVPTCNNRQAFFRPQLHQLDALRHIDPRIRLVAFTLLLLVGGGFITVAERDLLIAVCLLSQDGKLLNVYEGRLKLLFPHRLVQISEWFEHVYVHLLLCNDLLHAALIGTHFPETVSLLPLEEYLVRCQKNLAGCIDENELNGWYTNEVKHVGCFVWLNPAVPSAQVFMDVVGVFDRLVQT